WLSFDAATGTFSGTPPTGSAADMAITVTATDLAGATASQSLTLGIAPATPSGSLGTPGDDILNGTAGDDSIDALAGDDQVYAGAGHDNVQGGAGHDFVVGNEGDDVLDGGEGNDELYGDAGHDQLYGGWGDDRLAGGDGNDFLAGYEGNDLMFGGAGDDQLYADNGQDNLYGGLGNDQLYGGADSDYLHGGDGEDRLDGGQDRDVLAGGAGNDSLYGGADGDFYVIEAGGGTDTIYEQLDDTAAFDTIELQSIASGDSYSLSRVGDDLHIAYGDAGDSIVVRDQFAAGASAIEQIRFSDGVSLSAADIQAQAVIKVGRVDVLTLDAQKSAAVAADTMATKPLAVSASMASGLDWMAHSPADLQWLQEVGAVSVKPYFELAGLPSEGFQLSGQVPANDLGTSVEQLVQAMASFAPEQAAASTSLSDQALIMQQQRAALLAVSSAA
ncbi:calcium-binding protein, partial [Ottowia sp.]|uniref:calcium-binding protein n=1 Tax=Ottowia sp. TaxID=1898956 RepID=UPI003A849148